MHRSDMLQHIHVLASPSSCLANRNVCLIAMATLTHFTIGILNIIAAVAQLSLAFLARRKARLLVCLP